MRKDEANCCCDKWLRESWRIRRPCKTKPIARSGAPRRCLDCGLRIADCAKRSQFAPVGAAPRGLVPVRPEINASFGPRNVVLSSMLVERQGVGCWSAPRQSTYLRIICKSVVVSVARHLPRCDAGSCPQRRVQVVAVVRAATVSAEWESCSGWVTGARFCYASYGPAAGPSAAPAALRPQWAVEELNL